MNVTYLCAEKTEKQSSDGNKNDDFSVESASNAEPIPFKSFQIPLNMILGKTFSGRSIFPLLPTKVESSDEQNQFSAPVDISADLKHESVANSSEIEFEGNETSDTVSEYAACQESRSDLTTDDDEIIIEEEEPSKPTMNPILQHYLPILEKVKEKKSKATGSRRAAKTTKSRAKKQPKSKKNSTVQSKKRKRLDEADISHLLSPSLKTTYNVDVGEIKTTLSQLAATLESSDSDTKGEISSCVKESNSPDAEMD